MDWRETSEITGGLVLDGRIKVISVRPEMFYPDIAEVMKYYQKGIVKEALIEKVGIAPYQACLQAAKRVNGLGTSNWVSLLENSALEYKASNTLERMAKKAQRGDGLDWTKLRGLMNEAEQQIAGDFTPLSEIESGKIPFKKTGFRGIDKHLGGFPEVGQIIVGGAPGTGKTSFMAGVARCWAETHKEEQVAIFTLEMVKKEIAMRFREVDNKISKETQSRILISDKPTTPEKVISKAATIENLGLVGIDFADLLIQGDTTESAMAHIYRTFMLGAKSLNCPIMNFAQLNRTYRGGIPHPNQLRYTGLAEALGWMILMLYNPNVDFFSEEECEDKLPVDPRTAHLLAWKVRGGFRKHLEDCPGSIELPFMGRKGWSYRNDGRWHSLKNL